METVNGKLPEHLRSAINGKQDSELARLSTNGAQETVNYLRIFVPPWM